MNKLYEVKDDFEASITIFTEKEGGRKSPPINGIRWDFAYAENNPEGEMYMIWPDFFDENGDSFSKEISLAGTLNARMYILNKELIKILHRNRIMEGVEFYCMEGNHKVAKGIITKITGLSDYSE